MTESINRKIIVTKKLYPENQEKTLNKYNKLFLVSYPTYASTTGIEMLEIRGAEETSQMWRSEDNGRTWALADEIPIEEKMPDNTYARRRFGMFFLDPDNNILIRFQSEFLLKVSYKQIKDFYDHRAAEIANSFRTFYQISRDHGKTWDRKRQFIEKGEEYDKKHWARDVTYLESCAIFGEIPPFHKLTDGRVVIPCQSRMTKETDKYGTIQASRFYGRWKDDLSDIEWESAGKVYGGGCEQTTAVLKDGRMLNIMRAQGQIDPYLFDPWLRPYTVSENGGDTWSMPKPLTYIDGSGLTSPRAWSQLIRSEKNNRLYWIANILPAYEDSADIRKKYPAQRDPRHPLQIVEVDEDTLTLKKETQTIIADREPGESQWVRFSNCSVYNDRETEEIVLLVLKNYCELEKDIKQLPHPAYQYRITVPD